MKRVTIKKLEKKELEVLQYEINHFALQIQSSINSSDILNFLDSIIAIDIMSNLFYVLRNRIEKENTFTTLTLPISQASTIMKVCHFNENERSLYTKNVMLKISRIIDQQLKSFI